MTPKRETTNELNGFLKNKFGIEESLKDVVIDFREENESRTDMVKMVKNRL